MQSFYSHNKNRIDLFHLGQDLRKTGKIRQQALRKVQIIGLDNLKRIDQHLYAKAVWAMNQKLKTPNKKNKRPNHKFKQYNKYIDLINIAQAQSANALDMTQERSVLS
jgi:hypothetical protein